MSLFEQYQLAYAKADEKIKKIIDSDVIPNCAQECIKKFNLDNLIQQKLIQHITYNKLGVITDTELVSALDSLVDTNQNNILEFLTKCIEKAESTQTTNATYKNIDLTKSIEKISINPTKQPVVQASPNPVIPTPPPTTPPPPAPPSQQPSAPTAPPPPNLPQVRTMQGDMTKVSNGAPRWPSEGATYSSSQEALLRESARNKPSTPPPPTTPQN